MKVAKPACAATCSLIFFFASFEFGEDSDRGPIHLSSSVMCRTLTKTKPSRNETQKPQQTMTSSSISTGVPTALRLETHANEYTAHPLQGLTIETTLSKHADAAFEDTASYSSSSHEGEEEDSEFQDYNIDKAILAWDQVSDLTHEITSSLMAKQASMLCKRFRREEASLLGGQPTAAKKRRVEVPSSCSSTTTTSTSKQDMAATAGDASAAVVTIDEETAPGTNATLSDELSSQVGRIGRMSKLTMEIEYCMRELRKEMLSMSDQL
jgi:hypothetical protein